MNIYPTEPKSVTRLIGYSFSYYYKALIVIVPFVLLATIVKNLYGYWGNTIQVHIIHIVILIVMIIVQIYLWLTALYGVNTALVGRTTTFKVICRTVYAKSTMIYAGLFALILGFCALFIVGYLLSNMIIAIFSGVTTVRLIIYLGLIGIPITVSIVLCFFVLPILTLEAVTLFAAVHTSIRLVGYKHWLPTFMAYAAIFITILLVSPATRHGQWLRAHYLNLPFDMVVLVGLAPLIINFILLLLNDLRIRQRLL